MADIVEVWADTGVVVEREYTPEEATRYNEEVARFEEALAQELAEQERVREASIAAAEHARSLGFTDAMLSVMYPNIFNNL